MAEAVNEQIPGGPSPAAPGAATSPEGERQSEGVRLVTILYSAGRDLYRVPAIEKPCWLSVKVYPLPAAENYAQAALAAAGFGPDETYLGASVTADGKGWRKAYAITWRAIVAGVHVTIPADDPMVLDYAAYCTPSPAPLRERAG
jgi:hypothetical protein